MDVPTAPGPPRVHDPTDPPILVQKARSSLRAARAVVRAHPESAVIRSYYAVHHALRWRCGGDLPRGHGGITDPAVLARARRAGAHVPLLVTLQACRRRADDDPSARLPADVSDRCLRDATSLLRAMGVVDL